MYVARGHLEQGATQTGTITPADTEREREREEVVEVCGWEGGQAQERPCRLRGRQEASSAVLGDGGRDVGGGWGEDCGV